MVIKRLPDELVDAVVKCSNPLYGDVRELAKEVQLARIEQAAVDAWRNTECSYIWIHVATMDEGGYGCDGEHDGNHHEECAVATARNAMFKAIDNRRRITEQSRVTYETA